MSKLFQSNVTFSSDQIELMVTDIRDILGRLKDKNVVDFEKEKSIMLLNSSGTLIEFKRTELTEIKRFTSLISASFCLLEYLVRNPSSLTIINEVERDDRIMGSVNIKKTMALMLLSSKNIVVCNEIHKSMDTPESNILAQILFSIIIQCNKYLLTVGQLKSGARIDSPTLNLLASIRDRATDLLSSKSMKKVLVNAIANIENFEDLFKKVIEGIYRGKVPKHYVGMCNMLHKWKYFVWVSNRDPDLLEHSLRYYFFHLKNNNELYECWVMYKMLDIITDEFSLKLKEIGRPAGEITFQSVDRSLRVTYQPVYDTGWMYEYKPIHDRPDIVIEFKNSKVLIIDAKNSDLSESGTPYREQMDSYIRSAGFEKTHYGIFIFSKGEQQDRKQISRLHQTILWRTLCPSRDKNNESLNLQTVDELARMFKNFNTK